MKQASVLSAIIVALVLISIKMGQLMEQNKTLKITEATENRIDSIIANIALCEMALQDEDIHSSMTFAMRAKAHIIHIKNSIAHEPGN